MFHLPLLWRADNKCIVTLMSNFDNINVLKLIIIDKNKTSINLTENKNSIKIILAILQYVTHLNT